MPSRELLIRGPLRTSSEAVTLDKAEASGSVGVPTAGGRLRRLVVERQRNGVEHVLPVSLLPAPVLCEIDAEARVPRGDGDGDLALRGSAIADDGRARALRRVHGEPGMLARGKILRRSRQLVELVEP